MNNQKIAKELEAVSKLLFAYRVDQGIGFSPSGRLEATWETSFNGTFFDDLVAAGRAVQKEAVVGAKKISRDLMKAGLIKRPLVPAVKSMEIKQAGNKQVVTIRAVSDYAFTPEQKDDVASYMYGGSLVASKRVARDMTAHRQKDNIRGARGTDAHIETDNGHFTMSIDLTEVLEEALFKKNPIDVAREALVAAESAFYEVIDANYTW